MAKTIGDCTHRCCIMVNRKDLDDFQRLYPNMLSYFVRQMVRDMISKKSSEKGQEVLK